MKRFSEQLNKKAKSVKLRAAEKRELRERVVSYMEYHPLPKELQSPKTAPAPKLLTESYRVVSVPWLQFARVAAVCAVILVFVMPVLAERSVPGDGLYALKRFNEEVRSSLSFNAVQKVEWETERLNRRIAEARLLANEGRLTEEVEAEVVQAVRSQTANVQENIAALRAEDEDEATLASIAFGTTLAVQSAALNEDTSSDASVGSTTTVARPSSLAAVVEEKLEETNATNASSTIPAFDKVMAKVEVNTTRVYELRNSLTETATTDQIAEISRRIEDIERSVAEAISLRDEDDTVARTMLVQSLQRTQKLIVFMTDIDVSQTVDIETIVPVVLTPDEQRDILMGLETELEEKIVVAEKAVPNAEVEIAEKANVILLEIAELTGDIENSTEFTTSEAILTTALDLINNVLVLLELDQSNQGEVEEEIPVVGTATTTNAVGSTTEETVLYDESEVSESDSIEVDESVDSGESAENTIEDTSTEETGSETEAVGEIEAGNDFSTSTVDSQS